MIVYFSLEFLIALDVNNRKISFYLLIYSNFSSKIAIAILLITFESLNISSLINSPLIISKSIKPFRLILNV